MSTEVVMPQMGESVAEGTIVRWLKHVGDSVERDEPLFEISTDKVDAEIPSPSAGVVAEIRAKEGETVPVNSVVAVIAQAEARPATPAASVSAPQPPPHYHAVEERDEHAVEERDEPTSPEANQIPVAGPLAAQAAVNSGRAPSQSLSETIRQRSSPLVRKIAKEHNVEISTLSGTGISGRVTKHDILSFLSAAAPATERRESGSVAAPVEKPIGSQPAARLAPTGVAEGTGLAGQTVPMSVMRRKIAEHMVNSRRTSAHVHSVFEINFGRVDKIRQAKKAEYERQGAKLTYLSFIIKAAADALKAVPVINASIDGDSIVYHKQINIGVAVALDWGLIVPVVKDADQKTLLEVSRAVVDLANRARAKQLKPEDVTGGTFTITNPGVFGAIVGMPIISQPQLAIVSVGAVQKRVVVIDDAIAIRPMAFFSMGFDHRIIDGAVADAFLSRMQRTLETWDPEHA